MSTTIDVYPARWDLPLVEDTRARTEHLFQELLRRHGVASILTIEAFLPNDDGAFLITAPTHIRWHPGLDLRFAYLLNGVVQASSWPSCMIDDEPRGALDDWIVAEEFGHRLPRERLIRAHAIPHYWYEYRNMGGHAVDEASAITGDEPISVVDALRDEIEERN